MVAAMISPAVVVPRLVVVDDRADQRRTDDKRNNGFRGVARIVTTSVTRPVVGIGAGRKQAGQHGGHSGENPVLCYNIG